MPAYAPETMGSVSGEPFRVDSRPNIKTVDYIGDNRYVVFKLVRPQGVFYGVIVNGQHYAHQEQGWYSVEYKINTVPGDRGLVGSTRSDDADDWRKYVNQLYAEEDEKKTDKSSTAGRGAAKADPGEASRNLKMMRDNAYSGRWGCAAMGYDSISVFFDKRGLGFFDMVLGGFSRSESTDWGFFHWTADGNGAIDVHVVDCRGEKKSFGLRYDSGKNVMIPDLAGYPFATRVTPSSDNPLCEMKFMPGGTLEDSMAKFRKRKFLCGNDVTAWEEMLASRPRKEVASLDAFLALAGERLKAGGGVLMRGNDAPDVSARTDGDVVVVEVVGEITRGGDADAPRLECLRGVTGPDISGKKEHETFIGEEEFAGFVKPFGGKVDDAIMSEEGIWTSERRVVFQAEFKQERMDKCKALLKAAVLKWHGFPHEVIELEADED